MSKHRVRIRVTSSGWFHVMRWLDGVRDLRTGVGSTTLKTILIGPFDTAEAAFYANQGSA